MNIDKYCIDSHCSLRLAIKQLNEIDKKLIFIIKDEKLVGSLTDGDLRRFMLNGGTRDDVVLSAAHQMPHAARTIDKARILIKEMEYEAVPIIDNEGKIIDILFADEESKKIYPQINIPVVIMAGGKGTRLDPYTRVLPKPLIPIGDLPIIEHIMQKFTKYGCNEFHIIVNYKKQLLKAYFSENENQYDIHWHDEDTPLGTGGGLSLLKGNINQSFFLTNCDVLIQSDYHDIFTQHKESGTIVTMVCANKKIMIPYGVINTDKEDNIISMNEKPELSFLTNTGLYLVEPDVLDDIAYGVSTGFPDIIEGQMNKGRRVMTYSVTDNDWLDMGQLDELEKMRERLYSD